MSSEATYTVEPAKSGRAKCKKCKETIEKGMIKIIVAYPPKDDAGYGISSSYHLGCFKIPRKFSVGAAKLTPSEFVADHVQDGTPDQDLDHHEVIRKITEAMTTPKKTKQKEESGDDIMSRLKLAAKSQEDATEDVPPAKKKAKVESSESEEDFQKMLGIYHTYSKMTNPQLKDILRWNGQLLTGTKDFLVFKVIEGVLYGRLSVCPLCQAGLKFMPGDYDKIHCPGIFDDDIQARIPCDFQVPRLDSKDTIREFPFYTSEPTEEQKEEIKRIKEEKQEDPGKNDPVVLDLLKEAESLTVDLSTAAGKKKAADDFVALVDGKVDISDTRSVKLEVGRLIMAGGDKTPKEIMESIVQKYGTVGLKADKKAKQEEAVESMAGNPNNAPLIIAFRECSAYYFKEGNRNAGSTYVKAIATLSNLEEEVTKDNAMSFSKGKTKLAGIGKSTAQKMLEFVTTGTFVKLEEKRAAHA